MAIGRVGMVERGVKRQCRTFETIGSIGSGTRENHMSDGRVEMAVREVKRQCRTVRLSAEQKHECAHRR